jgi:tetratricopeptide (TPR) repeat protein
LSRCLSGSSDSLLAFADRQYLAGNYNLAIKEYLRIGYLCNFSDPFIQLRLADSYYRMGDWPTARSYYDQVFRLSKQDSLLIRSKLNKISSLVLEKKYKQALIDLYSINDSIYRKHNFDIDLLFAICYFGLEDFDKSRIYFKHAVDNDTRACAKIDSVFNKKKNFTRPNPAFAYTLSLFIPGLGQIYCGNLSDGLNSFVLTESLLVLGLVVTFEYSLIDALMSVLPWYQRYYMGGLSNTRELAIRQRQNRRSKAYKDILEIINEARK